MELCWQQGAAAGTTDRGLGMAASPQHRDSVFLSAAKPKTSDACTPKYSPAPLHSSLYLTLPWQVSPLTPLRAQTSNTFLCFLSANETPAAANALTEHGDKPRASCHPQSPVPVSLPVPDQGGQVAGELLLAGRHGGGPGPEGREALPGMDTADALGTGQERSDSNKPLKQSITTEGNCASPGHPQLSPQLLPTGHDPPCSGVPLAEGSCTRGFCWATNSE